MRRLACLRLGALFWMACAVSLAVTTAPDWVLRARSTGVSPELLGARPAPDAVVLWRQQIITAGASNGVTNLFEREAVKILSVSGEAAGTFTSSYDDDSKVNVEGAWTVHPDGTAEQLKLREVVSVQLAHAEYFTDVYVVAFRPPRLAPGDIASFALSRRSRRDVYQWMVGLQGANPVAAQEVVLDLPEGWTHHWRLTAAPEAYTGPLAGAGGAKASYGFGPQRGVPEEEAAPAPADRLARMEIVIEPPAGKFPQLVFRNWSDVGAWFYSKSLPARSEPPADVVAAVQGTPSDVARWVQDKVRYVALEAGEGGYVPREPAFVARRLYGDCKDKSFLTMALLAKKGIDAFPVLTRPRDDGAIDAEFPTPLQFDHVIVAVRSAAPTGLPAQVRLADGLAVLFDPTDSWTPYGELPASLQGARGLVVRRGSAELIEFPMAASRANRLTRRVDARITADRRLTATIRDTSEGALSQRRIYQEMTPTERLDAVNRFSQSHIPASRVTDLELPHLDDRSTPMEAKFSLSSDAYLRQTGSLLLLPVLPMAVGPSRIPDLEDRRSDIDLGLPKLRELTATFELPPGFRIDGLPDSVDVDNACCRYHFAVAVDGRRIVAKETYEVKNPLLPRSQIGQWKAIESAAARASASKAVLVAAN